jgi:hypothetical protein
LAENNGCILSQTAKDNKTPVFVNMQSSHTVDDDGAKSVAMKMGNKTGMTMMFVVIRDGDKLL